VDYGRGKSKRRTSRSAALSLLLSLLLVAFITATYWVFRHPDGRLEGVGAFLVIFVMFHFLCVAALILVPCSIVAGLTGMAAIRREPDRLRGRMAALLGIILAIVCGSTIMYTSYLIRSLVP